MKNGGGQCILRQLKEVYSGWPIPGRQDLLGPDSPQRVVVVDAVATGQCRGDQRQQLVASVGSTKGTTQVKVPVNQFTHSQMMGQGHGQDQPSVVHQTVIVEGDLDAVGAPGGSI